MATDPHSVSLPSVRDEQPDRITTWVHLDRPDLSTVQTIGAQLGVHPAHASACSAATASPRVDDHGAYLFLTLHMPALGPESPSGAVTVLSAIVTPRDLVTVQIGPGAALARVFRECQDDPLRRLEMTAGGPSALLARLVSLWIAGGSIQLDALGEESREVADLLLGRPDEGSLEAARDPETTAALARIRHGVTHARRVLEPQSRLLDSVSGLPATGDPARILWRATAGQMAALATRADALGDDAQSLLLAVTALNSQQTSSHTRLTLLLGAFFLPISIVLLVFATNIRDLPFVAEARGFETILALAAVVGLLGLYLLRRRV